MSMAHRQRDKRDRWWKKAARRRRREAAAPCAGFVWFRWLRPSCWHTWKHFDDYKGGHHQCGACGRVL